MSQTNVLFLFLLPARSALLLPLNHPITHGGRPSHSELRGGGCGGVTTGEVVQHARPAAWRQRHTGWLLRRTSCVCPAVACLLLLPPPRRPRPHHNPILLPTPHPRSEGGLVEGDGGAAVMNYNQN